MMLERLRPSLGQPSYSRHWRLGLVAGAWSAVLLAIANWCFPELARLPDALTRREYLYAAWKDERMRRPRQVLFCTLFVTSLVLPFSFSIKPAPLLLLPIAVGLSGVLVSIVMTIGCRRVLKNSIRRRMANRGFRICIQCGYDKTASDLICPECGLNAQGHGPGATQDVHPEKKSEVSKVR